MEVVSIVKTTTNAEKGLTNVTQIELFPQNYTFLCI